MKLKAFIIINEHNQPLYHPNTGMIWVFVDEGDAHLYIQTMLLKHVSESTRFRRVVPLDGTF